MIPEDMEWVYARYLLHKLGDFAHHHGLSAVQWQELDAWVNRRLAENDFALLRRRDGEFNAKSIFRVLDQLLSEYQVQLARGAARKAGEESGLFVLVTCVDVVVGSATFTRAEGLAHATFDPTSDYTMIAPHARKVWEWLKPRRYWNPMEGDLTDALSGLWGGEPLALEDAVGEQLAVSHVIVVDAEWAPYGVAPIRVVADFRPDHARVAAALSRTDLGSGGKTRPAA
jgi:hypothetical protein